MEILDHLEIYSTYTNTFLSVILFGATPIPHYLLLKIHSIEFQRCIISRAPAWDWLPFPC